MNPKVDEYLYRAPKWSEEMEYLRAIILDCDLTEELKWGQPCYTFQKKNVVVIQPFKAYLAILFFKGYLLDDPHHILQKTGPNTLVGRQIRFTSPQQITHLEPLLKEYIHAAIEVERSGIKAEPPTPTSLDMPPEFQQQLQETPTLRTAFDALTPGRQRAYLSYFSEPKQTKTRISRIEKSIDQIFRGKGPLEP